MERFLLLCRARWRMWARPFRGVGGAILAGRAFSRQFELKNRPTVPARRYPDPQATLKVRLGLGRDVKV
jgi:hypothetical protein